jgi:hypothetical protein
MTNDPIRGKTVLFTFDDGPMAKKTFAHVFGANGTVEFSMVGADAASAPKEPKKAPDTKYEAAPVGGQVFAVSYLSPAGYTLTTMLDFETHRLVAFSSNEKMLAVQHGTFEVAGMRAGAEPRAARHHAG